MNFLPGAAINGCRVFGHGAHILDLAGQEGGAIPDRPKTIPGLRPEHPDLRHDPDPRRSPPAAAGIDAPREERTIWHGSRWTIGGFPYACRWSAD